MEDKQNHEVKDDESLNDSGEGKQNSVNNYTEEDEEEEKIQVENANNIHSGEIGIICGNEINENENGTNDDSTNEETATMKHPTIVKIVWRKAKDEEDMQICLRI